MTTLKYLYVINFNNQISYTWLYLISSQKNCMQMQIVPNNKIYFSQSKT